MPYSIEFLAALAFVWIASFAWIIAKAMKLPVPVTYGRHEQGKLRFRIPTRLSWVIMEAPASLVFACVVLTGPLPITAPIIALLVMWQLHYVHRAFIYPFQLKIRPGSSTPATMTLFGAVITSLCGYLNGDFISRYGVHLQSSDWFYSPAFMIGTALFAVGFVLNKISDATLMRLRKENPNAYSIPTGGAYRWVSCPNYLGEIITWIGFACAAWSIAGITFAFMTASNLVIRAIENHRWYHEKFTEYPKERKAIFPYLL